MAWVLYTFPSFWNPYWAIYGDKMHAGESQNFYHGCMHVISLSLVKFQVFWSTSIDQKPLKDAGNIAVRRNMREEFSFGFSSCPLPGISFWGWLVWCHAPPWVHNRGAIKGIKENNGPPTNVMQLLVVFIHKRAKTPRNPALLRLKHVNAWYSNVVLTERNIWLENKIIW